MDDAQLQTVWQQRQFKDRATHLGQPLAYLMKHRFARLVRQLSNLAKIWDEVIPAKIAEHTALESFHRGVLTVVVDSAAHRFRLQVLLMGGLQKAIQERFNGPLNKIRLMPGQFQSVELPAGSEQS